MMIRAVVNVSRGDVDKFLHSQLMRWDLMDVPKLCFNQPAKAHLVSYFKSSQAARSKRLREKLSMKKTKKKKTDEWLSEWLQWHQCCRPDEPVGVYCAGVLLGSGRLLARYFARMLEVYEGGGDSRPISGVFSQRELGKLAFWAMYSVTGALLTVWAAAGMEVSLP